MAGNDQTTKKAKILILGIPEVGKTSLVRRLTNIDFSTEYKPTVGVSFASDKLNRINYWDACGNSIKSLINIYLKDTDAVIICFDPTNHDLFTKLDGYLQQIKEHSPYAQIFLVATKMDMEKHKNVNVEKFEEFALKKGCELYLTSAKNNIGFEKLQKDILTLSKKVTQQSSHDTVVDLSKLIDAINDQYFKQALQDLYSDAADSEEYDDALKDLIKGYNKLMKESNPHPDEINKLFSTFESKCKPSWTKTTFKLIAVVIVTGIFSLLGMVAGATMGIIAGALAGVPLGPLAVASAATGASSGGVTGLALGTALGTMAAGVLVGATACSISAISLFKPSEQDKLVDRVVHKGINSFNPRTNY